MGDYPTDDQIAEIERWPVEKGAIGWFKYIQTAGNYWPNNVWGWDEEYAPNGLDDDKGPLQVYRISTGGWSGNEEIIDAMEKNVWWGLTWHSSRRGGHYEFRVPLVSPYIKDTD